MTGAKEDIKRIATNRALKIIKGFDSGMSRDEFEYELADKYAALDYPFLDLDELYARYKEVDADA